jgi:hypothetical protein
MLTITQHLYSHLSVSNGIGKALINLLELINVCASWTPLSVTNLHPLQRKAISFYFLELINYDR